MAKVKWATSAQVERQRVRERNGQYAQSEPCEACGKPAGFDYWSLGHANEGGLTLCNRVRCPAQKLWQEGGDAAVLTFIKSRRR